MNVDIKENALYQLDNELLLVLLKDRSSGQNIIWATDNYSCRGYGYNSSDYITVDTNLQSNYRQSSQNMIY